MKNKKNCIGIYWDDIRVYHKGEKVSPTCAYTEGTLVYEDKNFFFVQNPETLISHESGVYNHPKQKARWYVIPKVLVTRIEQW